QPEPTMLHRSALPQVLLPMLAGAFLLSCGDPPGPVIPTTARIVVTPATDTLSAFGETVQLSAVAQDNIGNVIPGVAFAWSSSAGGVISISSSGVATAVTNGSATITAEVSGVTGSTSLT